MSTLTPLEHWRVLTRNFSSADIFVEAGFYAMVAAALQRRVWKGALDEGPLFANMYTLFCAPPAIAGKGLVTDLIMDLFKSTRYVPRDREGKVKEEEHRMLQEREAKEGKVELLIPVGPDSITFEKLLQNLSRASRPLHVKPPLPRGLTKSIYFHASMVFVLDEFTSFINEDAEKVPKFLETSYNCKDYTNETKHHGDDVIRNCCLNMLAGTQPKKFRKLLRREILESGIISRTFVIYADKERQRMHKKAAREPDQIESFKYLKDFITNLAACFGQVDDTPEADEWLKDWWANEPKTRPNKSPVLEEYYGRKNQHVPKLAMILRFCENPEKSANGTYLLEVRHYEEALAILAGWEKNMHLAFEDVGDNKIGSKTGEVEKLLAKHPGGMTFDEVFFHMYKDLRREELMELLTDAVSLGKIVSAPNSMKTITYKLK